MPRKSGDIHPNAIAFIVYPNEQQFNNDNQTNVEYIYSDYEAKSKRIIEIFKAHCFKGFISPLHEPEEENKKYHFHVMLIFPLRKGLSLKSYREIVNLCDGANGFFEPLYAPHEYSRYIIHNGEKYKDKKLYYPHQVKEIGISYQEYSNIFDYEANILEDNTQILINIIKYINDMQIVMFNDLVDYSLEFKLSWLPVIKSNAHFLKEYMKSYAFQHRLISY